MFSGRLNWLAPLPKLPKVVWLLQLVLPALGRAQTEMRRLRVSATQAVSVSPETATPVGLLNWFGPMPLLPKVVWLLQVVLLALGRAQVAMRWLPVSATQAVSVSLETAMPIGLKNWLGPVPKLPKVVWLVQVVLLMFGRVQMEMRWLV